MLIFPDELCVAQGMGWFDDQLNFDSTVSLSCLDIEENEDEIMVNHGC